MSEPVFFKNASGLTLGEIADLIGVALPAGVAERRLRGVAPLDQASPSQLAFFDDPRFEAAATITDAGVCLVTPALAGRLPKTAIALVVPEPYRAFVTVTRAMFPQAWRPSSLYEGGKANGAHIHPSARLEDGVTVEPGASIGPGAEIGSGSVIAANAVIGGFVRIGRDCAIGANASISHALIGDRVIVHPGCTIGQDGFGFVMSAKGQFKAPQLGRVIIQDGVEIGAGTAIDRGAIDDTVIGEGTKIDNLVQVGHNVHIGRHCRVAAQSGIADGSTLEDHVVLAARVGLSRNTTVAEGAQIDAVSGISGEIPARTRWTGTPAVPMK